MKKVVLCFMLLLISIGSAFSQFDAQLSQYMFHISSFNPAAVGESNLIQITGQNRNQWLGIPNAGQTTIFSINSPLKIANSNNGLGFTFLNDKVGLFTNQSAHLQYAYKKKLGSGVLSIGTDIGFVSIGFKGDSVKKMPNGVGDFQDIEGDKVIPKTSVVGMSFDMNVGVYYSNSTYYGGLSLSHLNSPTVTWGDSLKFKLNGLLYLTGGYNLVLADSKYVLKPSTLIKTDFSSIQWDLSTILEYNNKYWGGISYRVQDAVVVLAGINISGGLSVGFSYDLPTSKIITVSYGSPELVVMYSFEYMFGKRNSKYKSIRIL